MFVMEVYCSVVTSLVRLKEGEEAGYYCVPERWERGGR